MPGRAASAPGPPPRGEAFEASADRVAEAWRAAPLSDAWRHGYVPLEPSTVLPRDPGFDDATKQAFLAGWYRDRTPLSATRPGSGTIRFPDGSLTVPVISADEAYRQLDQGDPPPCQGRPPTPPPSLPAATAPDAATATVVGSCTPLTVTAAKLGTVTVQTSRGAAQVPAWLFTVDELSGPVAQIAIAASAVSPVPSNGLVPPTGAPPSDLVMARIWLRWMGRA